MSYSSMGRLFLCVVVISLLAAVGAGCGPGEDACASSKDCKRSYACERGVCVLADNDKDGWAKGKDCNDGDKNVHPQATELCDNGIDDNCDGKIDEQPCECKGGTTRACGSKVGACKQGIQTCSGGVWGPCQGALEPQPEVCDGQDNDCDGKVDEEVPNCCEPGETRACGSAEGECKKGTQSCEAGKWGACQGGIAPKDEVCNDKDDDCDGRTDNLKDTPDPLKRDCFSGPADARGKGTCKDGFQLCKRGMWGKCQGDVIPVTEICDGKDNDCDGQIDNVKGSQKVMEQSCYSGPKGSEGKGTCKAGVQRCESGQWGKCQGEVMPVAEACNGVDDDCDGQIDNAPKVGGALTRSCFSGPADARGKGLCVDGIQRCIAGKWTACKGDRLPQSEDCDKKDNDCDGQIDNIQGKPDPLTRPCYTGPAGTGGQGICKQGTQSCVSGKWLSCTGETWPQTEVCDGKDNDCNGKVDDLSGAGAACTTGKQGECAAGKKVCVNGQLTCQPINQPSAEVCDNKDNDCNGKIDDGNPGGGNACKVSGVVGVCVAGTMTCKNGRLECVSNIPPRAEMCNGKDDNCDGNIDENATCPRGTECRSSSCQVCSGQPTTKCPNFDSFCTGDAPTPQCKCGLTPYCKTPSASIYCAVVLNITCCAEKACR